ncbi:MAG: hypothetical protein ACXV2G_06570 [Actinomycetes bacterium]
MTVIIASLLGRGGSAGDDGSGVAGPDASGAVGWIVHNVDRHLLVAADASAAAGLRRAGYPKDRVVELADLTTTPDLVLEAGAADSTARAVPPAATAALRRSVVVARFGSGSGRAEVRQVLPAGTSAAKERQVRADVADGLLTNVRLRLTPGAWARLARGQTDPRLLAALSALSARHDVDVLDLPRTAPERRAAAPARSVRVTALDGAPLTAGSPALRDVLRLLRAQRPPYRPGSSTVEHLHGRTVLRITYPAPSPFGLVAPTPTTE